MQYILETPFCHEEYIDGQRALTYSIPAMITMNQFITKKIHRDELVDIMFSIADQLMYLKANDMPLGKVILNIGYMYLNLEDMSVQLVFLPIDKPMEKCNMEKFVRDLVNKLDFANKKASDCGYELIKFFDHNSSFYLSEFYKMITDMKNDNNVHPEDEQHFIVRPQKAEAIEDMIRVLINAVDLQFMVDAGIGNHLGMVKRWKWVRLRYNGKCTIATAGDVPEMAAAFKLAIETRRKAYLTGMGRVPARGGSTIRIILTGFFEF